MATNYLFSEAVQIISAGTDSEAIVEIGKRFPQLTVKVAKVSALAGEDFVELMSYIPAMITANKVNTMIKNATGEADEVEGDDDEVEEKPASNKKPTAKAPAKKVADDDEIEDEFSEMSSRELYSAASKAGLIKGMKSTKKVDLLAALRANASGETEEDEVEETENPYEGKTAQELFKEAKSRGLKVEPKKNAKFYTELLLKDDASAEDEEESWDEEEAVEEKKPAKTAAKSSKAKAPADEEEWDI